MFRWLTVFAALAASVLCASYWLRRRARLAGRLLAALAAATAVALLLHWERLDGWVPLALAAGQLAGLLAGGRRLAVFPEVCLYFCADMVLAPLCRSGEEVWRYALVPAVLAVLLLVSLPERDPAGASPLDFYPDRKQLYYGASALPCLVLMPEIPLLLAGTPDMPAALLLSGTFFLLLCLGLYLQYEAVGRRRAEEMGRAMNRWQLESRDYMNVIRSQRHDFNLHLHAISGLLGSGAYAACGEYVAKLVADASAVNDIMPVNDAVVGSMLYNMREEARRRGSDIAYHITYDMADTICSGFDCNKIIGNLLQNAIDALQTQEDRDFGIRLSIFKRRGNAVILCENRFTGDPDRIAAVFTPGFSTKQGHEGIGLTMVLRTVTLYGGRIYPEFEGETLRFVVNIPNKVNLTEGGAL